MVDAVAPTTTRYYYDGQRVLLETDYDSGTQSETDLRYFVYGNYIDEVLVMADIDGGAVNTITDGDYYFAHDHLYSPAALFDEDGTVVERYEYDAYGKATVYTDMGDWDSGSPSTQAASDVGNPYLFTGRRLDAMDYSGSQYQLNLMYYRARTYDPQTGRFMQRDPMQYIDGVNSYEYAKNCPVMLRDSLGYFAEGISRPNLYLLPCNRSGEPGIFDFIITQDQEPQVNNLFDATWHFLFGDGSMRYWSDPLIRSFRQAQRYKHILLALDDDSLFKAKKYAKCGHTYSFTISGEERGTPESIGSEIIVGDWIPTIGGNINDIVLALQAGGALGAGVDELFWYSQCWVKCEECNGGKCKCNVDCTIQMDAHDKFNIKFKASAGPYIILIPFGTPYDSYGTWQECYHETFWIRSK